jgi:hypothetical protein
VALVAAAQVCLMRTCAALLYTAAEKCLPRNTVYFMEDTAPRAVHISRQSTLYFCSGEASKHLIFKFKLEVLRRRPFTE